MPLFRARCCYGRCRELVRDPARLSRLWPGHIATLRACAQICTAQVRSSPRLTDQQPLWQGATVEQRQRLHGALFPKGLTYDGENFGTGVTCVAFSQLQDQKNSKEGMASPRNNRDRGLSLPPLAEVAALGSQLVPIGNLLRVFQRISRSCQGQPSTGWPRS